MKMGQLPKNAAHSVGRGQRANAVLAACCTARSRTCWVLQVLQDGMQPAARGKMSKASATAISLSRSALKTSRTTSIRRERIITRKRFQTTRAGAPPEHRRHELDDRADICNNINSTHLMGTSMMNGIGGSGDCAQWLPFVLCDALGGQEQRHQLHRAHGSVDHTEHDTQIIVTEQGLADLRGSRAQRAQVVIITVRTRFPAHAAGLL